ncbi:synaptotagmin-like protein 2 isoform X2 [Hippocampus zosterae]|uniref:synaptotagmin-like protein 2 isoform X2 n=1 Tax=Hippocampus zosterae TaxID=109293 RepID=UPI00223E80DA|nr:synaptotagmin-like protein 2 isoform X2 [Hippocampus zosterae]
MIDLSFLTEEEHGVIMTVLRRDAQLKRAEEQRIRKLESILSEGSSSDSKLKYLTGQWFYEAKSRRHMDKIHGSEIILASMKQRSTSEGSYRSERLRAASSQSCDVEVPQKPARCLDIPLELNNAEKDDMTSAVHSPRMTRHNPFNRPSLIVVEPAEGLSEIGEQKLFSDTNPNAMFPNGISPSLEASFPPKSQQHSGSSQTSGTSMTSEGSTAGFRPVPKKRTCTSKQTSSVSGSSGTAPDPQLVSVGFLPALRRSLNQGSNGSSTRSMGEVAGSAHSSVSTEIPQQLSCDASQVLSHSSLEGGRKPSLVTADRGDALLDGDTAQMIEDSSTHRERLTVGRMQDSDPVIGSSVISSVKEPEWQRTADPPISYDINFIEPSHQKRSQQKRSFKLTTQISSPTGNDEDSISKVLDWFNRSTDGSDWLNGKIHRNRETHVLGSEKILKKDVASIREKESVEITTGQSEGPANEMLIDAKNVDGESHDTSEMKSFGENTKKYPQTMTSTTPGDIAVTREGNEKTPNIHSGVFDDKVTYVANVVNGSQHVGLKHDQELESFDLGNPDSMTAHPQVAERKGSDVELLFVEQLAPKSTLWSSPESQISLGQPETLHQSIDLPSPQSEKIHLSQSRHFQDLKTCGNDGENICTTPGNSSEDHAQSPKTRDADSPHSPKRQNHPRQESTAAKIKQLKMFWEQEASKPSFNGSKPKGMRGAKLNKRFTKSEFDLRAIANNSGSDGEDSNRGDSTGLPLNQRIDKISPTLDRSRAQFSSLLEFWDDATTDSKPKGLKRQVNTPPQPQELHDSEPEPRHLSPVETTRVAVNDNKKNLPESGLPKEPKKTLKDSSRQERDARPPPTPTKEARSSRKRKDSFSHSSSRGRSMRRAASMFSLVDPEESTLKIHVSPVDSQSRKQSGDRARGIKRASDGPKTPLARAFVPQDYSHYLGLANEPGTLPPEEEGFGGPMRTSTPTGSEERRFNQSTRMSPPYASINNKSTDADNESPITSTSESWSNSRNIFKCKNDEEEENPVRKALRRAEARPKGLAKSMEDLAGSLSPRQERRPKLKTDTRQIGATVLPPSRLFLGHAHLKKMSKSVPSFLQRQDDSPIYEDIFHPMDYSFDLASVSSFSGSVMTMESGDFGSVDVQGSIQFSINYVQKLREFHIFVAQCRDLAAADPKKGRSDPYVKSYLVPDKIHLGKKKTSVKKKTLNPTFNEILRYHVSSEYLRTQTLVLSVWHHDTFGRNNFLGEVDTDLSKWDFDHTHMNDLPLRARTRRTLTPSSGRGEMRVAVRFLPKVIHSEANDAPTTGEIHIWVKECKRLPLIRATIDPYVKCFVLPDTSRKSRQKTRVLRKTADPVFNHTMVYDGIREVDLAEACVELSVWDRDKLASSLLGGVRLGAGTGRSYGSAVDWMDSTPEEVALWARMAAWPNEWAEAVLPLRMMSSAKTAFR